MPSFCGLQRHPLVPLALCLALATAACASGGRSSSTGALGDPDLVTAEELTEVPGTNLYDVLLRVRPLWLSSEGARERSVNARTEIVVLTDGRYFGELESLRDLAVSGVRRIRRVTGSDVARVLPASLIGQHVEAVILVEHRNPREG